MIPPLFGLKPDHDFAVLLGDKLGESTARAAFLCRSDPTFVIKVSKNSPYSNWVEYITWGQIKDHEKLANALGSAPALSVSGKYLLMERLDDVPPARHGEITLPCWITDRKADNFGVDSTGRIKMRDYANLALGEFLEALPIVRRA